MEEQHCIKINQLPSKTWYWLGMNDTKVTWTATKPCVIRQEEETGETGNTGALSGFPENINTGAGSEANDLFDAEHTCCQEFCAESFAKKQTTLMIGQSTAAASGRIRARAKEGSCLTLFEVFENTGGLKEQLAVRTELLAEKNSKIRLVQVILRDDGQELLDDIGGICGEHATIEILQLVMGRGTVYDGIQVELQKDHAAFLAELGYLLQNHQKLDVNLNVRHFGKSTESDIRVDGTLLDQAEKIFRGTIDFVRGSADSVGAETEQVLLLGEEVINKTIPVILCEEENVQGSHGASIGALDEDTLFYFETRGIDRMQAENFMAQAKMEEKIGKIGNHDIEQKAEQQLAEVIGRDNR